LFRDYAEDLVLRQADVSDIRRELDDLRRRIAALESPPRQARLFSLPPDKCYKTGSKIETSESETTVKQNTELQIKDMIDKIKFSASLNLSAEYSDYGVVKPITAPEGAFDLVDYIDNQPGL
jgi:hypothetical protein